MLQQIRILKLLPSLQIRILELLPPLPMDLSTLMLVVKFLILAIEFMFLLMIPMLTAMPCRGDPVAGHPQSMFLNPKESIIPA